MLSVTVADEVIREEDETEAEAEEKGESSKVELSKSAAHKIASMNLYFLQMKRRMWRMKI